MRPTLPRRWREPRAQRPQGLDERARALGLRPKGAGYVRVRNPDDRFDAFIRADGQVVFTLDRQVTMTVDGVCAFAICVGGKKSETTRKKKGAKRAALVATMLAESALLGVAPIGPWGYGTPRAGPLPGTLLQDPPPYPGVTVVGRYGRLPAPLSEMSTFMDETFAIRTELAAAEAKRRIADASTNLGRRLDALWTSEPTPAARRAAVLELWSELDADAPPRDVPLAVGAGVDALRASAAHRVRAQIVAAVREHLPASSPEAFSKAALEAFNKTSGVPFCPYAKTGCGKPEGAAEQPSRRP